MGIFLIIIFGVFLLFFPTVTVCGVKNPHLVIYYALKDVYIYFKHKKYNKAPYGYVRCFVAALNYAFGAGKTLFGVHEIIALYRKYNGLQVWCDRRKKFVTQRILVLSNVEFKTIPYLHLKSLEQYSELPETVLKYDDEHDTLTVSYTVCDEASSQMNSRAFMSNFSPKFIEDLLTMRHFYSAFYLTAQDFMMIDKLMRRVVTTVVTCAKLWRFQRYSYYSAKEIENATNELIVKPIKKGCWFIQDKDFMAYDTHAMLESFVKSYKDGDMMSELEILDRIGSMESDIDAVNNFSKRYKKVRKRMYR